MRGSGASILVDGGVGRASTAAGGARAGVFGALQGWRCHCGAWSVIMLVESKEQRMSFSR